MKDLYVISGVTGMTGNEVARQLVNKGHTVLGFDNFFASSIESVDDIIEMPNFHFYEYDIDNDQQMGMLIKIVEQLRKDFSQLHFINCAAVVHTEYFYLPDATFKTNVIGMKNFLQYAIEQQADTFINCSTSEVYSMQSWNDEGGIRESSFVCLATAEHSLRTSYATGKLMTEFFIMDAVKQGKIKGCSIRFANVYSKHERFAKHIIPHIYESLKSDKQVVLLENSKQNRRTFLHNNDSCAAVLALIDSPEALDGSTYNVATEEEVSIIELVELIGHELGISAPKIIFEGYRESDPVRRVLNTEKIQRATNWRPKVSLCQGLAMLVAHDSGNCV